MGSDSSQLFQRSLARRAQLHASGIPCSAFLPPNDAAVQTDIVRGAFTSLRPVLSSTSVAVVSPPTEIVRLPSVDDLTCDAGYDSTVAVEQQEGDASDATMDSTRDLSLMKTVVLDSCDVDTVVDGKVLWTQQMAQLQFGVVPVVELADFINL
jgi:hypothetical protein